MNKRIKVIEIRGFRGALTVAYMVFCLAGGFLFFPAWVIMSLWNLFSTYVYSLPHMSLIHGFMMYVLFVLLYFATNSDKAAIGISSAKMSKSHIAALLNDVEEDK